MIAIIRLWHIDLVFRVDENGGVSHAGCDDTVVSCAGSGIAILFGGELDHRVMYIRGKPNSSFLLAMPQCE